jgi:hypothetical protein
MTPTANGSRSCQAYPGGVNTIDAFEGGLAEDHARGSDAGPLFQAIMVNQFTRLRDGDRFFYLHENLNAGELAILRQGNTLAKVIEANTNITNLQANVFLFKASISGSVLPNAPLGPAPGRPAPISLAGFVVRLQDDSGNVLATTRTDRQGHYTFTQLSGPSSSPAVTSGVSAVGSYKVVLLPRRGSVSNARVGGTIVIGKGDTNVNEVNFTVDLPVNRPELSMSGGMIRR